VTTDEIANPHDLTLELQVDGEIMQSSSTCQMIFKVADLVAYVSAFMTLWPGDIIATGTPAGVGMGRRPERYLSAGEILELDGGPLGRQVHRVVAGTADN
jgi:2,4-didehydro-3-deoxy-L-rhamnonate hydrolase